MELMDPDPVRKLPLWTEISTDFDPDEETANFGTRVALESQGSIYEVRFLLLFKCRLDKTVQLIDEIFLILFSVLR